MNGEHEIDNMRLFTFGCSFTQYDWPTWADILGKQFPEYYNYGMCGGGNLFIFDSLVEAIARHNINANDTICIMWTNVLRDDRYLQGHWFGAGNLYTSKGYHTKEFLDKFVTIRGCYVRDMPFIYAAYKLLKNIRCKFYFTSMVDIDNYDQYSHKNSEDIQDVLELYKEAIDFIRPSIHKVIFDYDWQKRFKKNDPHPHPIDYLEYIERILPEFDLSPTTKKWVVDIDNRLKNNLNINNWRSIRAKRL